MELTVIGTGSKGNCYLLRAEDDFLLLDAGVNLTKIVACVPKFSRVAACLVTHEHMDHAKSAKKLAQLGVPAVMSRGTAQAVFGGEPSPALREIVALEKQRFGPFIVLAFPTEHDAQEPLGFLVRYAPTGETLLYATDTYYLRHTFPGVHYWLVECSFEEEIVDAQLARGEIDEALAKRLRRSHMSLRRLCDALRANDLHAARAVVLIHMSDARSDERAMIEAAQRASGVDAVYAAHAGDVIQLELAPF